MSRFPVQRASRVSSASTSSTPVTTPTTLTMPRRVPASPSSEKSFLTTPGGGNFSMPTPTIATPIGELTHDRLEALGNGHPRGMRHSSYLSDGSGNHAPSRNDEKLPFQEFQQVLSFLASIGLATTVSCAFSLVGINSSFGDSSPEAMNQIKRSADLLAWAGTCFIIALVFIVAPQLLYTELVIVEIIRQKRIEGWSRRLVRVSVGVFAWVPLMFQVAAMLLLSESLKIFVSRAALMARWGIVGGVLVVAVVTVIGLVSEKEGRRKLKTIFTICASKQANEDDGDD